MLKKVLWYQWWCSNEKQSKRENTKKSVVHLLRKQNERRQQMNEQPKKKVCRPMSFLPLKNCSNRRKKNCRLPEMLRSRPPLFHNYVCSRKLANDTLIGSSARQSRSGNRWGTKISTLSRYDCSQELEAASFSYCNFEREFESIIPPVKHCPPPSEHLFLRVLKQKEKKKTSK